MNTKIVKANNRKVANSKANELTVSERNLLAKCRADIAKGFEMVGKALGTIRDKKLYRETHRTFEQFVLEEFQIARRIAYRYIDAAKAVENVSDASTPAPTSESVARPLTDLKPTDQKKVWEESVKTTPKGKKVTAKHVQATKEKLLGKKKVVKHNFRKDAMNSKADDVQNYTLPKFEKSLKELVTDFVKHKLPVSTIVTSLEAEATELRKQKLVKAS